jgi:hypothetical protein
MGKIPATIGLAADAITIWQALHPMLQKFF